MIRSISHDMSLCRILSLPLRHTSMTCALIATPVQIADRNKIQIEHNDDDTEVVKMMRLFYVKKLICRVRNMRVYSLNIRAKT